MCGLGHGIGEGSRRKSCLRRVMRPRGQRNCICHFGEIGWDIGEEVTGSTCCRMGRQRNGNGIWCCRRNLRHGALGDVNGRRWKGRELVV